MTHEEQIAEAEHLARYEIAAAAAPGRTVLDVGCGSGYGAALLGRAGARAVTAIDADPSHVLYAQKRFSEAAVFTTADAMALPFRDSSFDLVVCLETIDSVGDADTALGEIERVLSGDGLLVLSGAPDSDVPDALRTRFKNVARLSQRTCSATVIGPAEPDGGRPAEAPAGELRAAEGDASGEQAFVAFASNAELSLPSALTVLTPADALAAARDAAETWQARARRAEAERDAQQIRAGYAFNLRESAVDELEELRRRIRARGRSWRDLLSRDEPG